MTVTPTSPSRAAAVSAVADVLEALDGSDLTTVAEAAINAALPHLLPGLYLIPETATIWASIWCENPERPTRPEHVLTRVAHDHLAFDILAPLLPSRTEDEG